MENDNRLKLSGCILDFTVWDDTINLFAVKFYEKFSVYPNILLASDETYRKIDLYAQMQPDRLIAPDDETILSSNESYTGISDFIAEEYTLECCFDYDLTEGNFILIFDEAPDFGGEPILEEEKEAGIIYQYKRSA